MMRSLILLLPFLCPVQDDPIQQILKDLENEDAEVRTRGVEAAGKLDTDTRKKLGPWVDKLAGKLLKSLDSAAMKEVRKLMARRPAGRALQITRKQIKDLGEQIKDQSAAYEPQRRDMWKLMDDLWKSFYPDYSVVADGEAVVGLREKLESVKEVASESTGKKIDRAFARLSADRTWEFSFGGADLKIMQLNLRLYEESRGGLKMDVEEYRFSVSLNLYRVMMGLRAIKIDLKSSKSCRDWSKGLDANGGKLVHSSHSGENLMSAGSGHGAWRICTGDWPHHRQYFAAGKIGIGRCKSVWTFRG